MDSPAHEAGREEDKLFHLLFTKVAEKFRRHWDIPCEAIDEATEDLKNPFREHNNNAEFSKISFDELENCYAYMKRLATCHASMTRFAVDEIFSRHSAEFFTILHSRRQSVVSLGSGPGNDAIGFCNALAGHRSAGRVDVCNVDLWERWSTLQDKMVQVIGNNPEAFFDELNVRFDFLQADVLSKTSRNHIRRIRDADVVLIVKFVSILPENDRDEFLKMVLSNMKPGSTIFYIDTQAYRLRSLATNHAFQVIVRPDETRWYQSNCDCGNCIVGSSYEVCVMRKYDFNVDLSRVQCWW